VAWATAVFVMPGNAPAPTLTSIANTALSLGAMAPA